MLTLCPGSMKQLSREMIPESLSEIVLALECHLCNPGIRPLIPVDRAAEALLEVNRGHPPEFIRRASEIDAIPSIVPRPVRYKFEQAFVLLQGRQDSPDIIGTTHMHSHIPEPIDPMAESVYVRITGS
jgi:hypothetical protein